MGTVRDDEHDRPSYTRTKSAARLFNELLERVGPDASSDKVKSPPFTSKEAAVLPNITSSPTPMDAPNFTQEDSSSNPQRIFENLQSQYNQNQPKDPSPTDSHPRNHPRNHTRRRSPRSTETISAMLLLATERLAQETSRANEAERQSSEILSHLKIAHHTKQRLEIDLRRANDELGLYKTQLDNAQAEIRRAQETVDKVDRQRADAEDEARRGREKIRKLTETRSIELAMEEGRRLGYEEGMRQGRLKMQARELNRPSRYSRRNSVRTARDDDDDYDCDDQVTYFSYTQEEWQSTESFQPYSEPSTVRSSRRRRTSDARHSAHPTSPISTSSPTSHNQIPLSTQPNEDSNEPENIAVRPHSTEDTDPTTPIRPISIRNRSPTVSHRSFKLPPDGYIPTIGANSIISLPPPHELSMPVPPTTPQPSATASSLKGERKKAPTSRSSEHADRESRNRAPQAVDEDRASNYTPSRQLHANNRHKEPAHARPKSVASGVSTYISQSSLLGPPDSNNTGRKESNEEPDYFTAGARKVWSLPQPSTQFEKIPLKKRVTNPDKIPASPSQAQSFLDKNNETTSKMQGNFTIERPSSTDQTKRRKPREIVLPQTPLIGSLPNFSTVQKPNGTAQEAVHKWRDDIDGPSSPRYHNPRPQYLRGSVSNTSVPGIEIMTPSSPTLSTLSTRTVINPILLTPESARATPLLQPSTEIPPTTSLGLYSNRPLSMSGDEQRITMILPDNNLPPGFIPLSPIQGMKNLDSCPAGFAPSISKLQDGYPGGQLPSNFSYPSSPLIRSRV